MSPIKVLVVDDSVVVRKLISKAIEADPDLEVAGTAAHGRIALTKIDQLDPDIVILDVEMPEMDGLETLTELRRMGSTTPVIMFSSLTDRGSEITVEALARGAADYVTKPADTGSPGGALATLEQELLPKLKLLVPGFRSAAQIQNDLTGSTKERQRPGAQKIDAVVIGSSTGGPNALATVLGGLERPLDVPIFIVQHIPENFSRLLAERLDRGSVMRVVEANHGDRPMAGTVYLAPGGRHMTVEYRGNETVIDLNDGPLVNSCRPSVDVLFRSAAKVYAKQQLGIILTGMGDDGLDGCRELVELGAPILSQDQATSIVWGMPAAVVNADLADEILPITDIAERLTAWVESDTSPIKALVA